MNRKAISGIPKYSLSAISVLAIAMMMPIASTLAAPDCSDPKHKDKPVCVGGPVDGSIVYTAKLSGAFVFNEDVTPNKRESSLHSDRDLELERPGYDTACSEIADEETYTACQTWNHVFNTCLMLLDDVPDSVVEIRVGDDDWSIQRPGGVYVKFGDMPVPGAKISVNLYGNKESEDPFLPDPTLEPPYNTSVFVLDEFATWGKSLPGEDGSMSLGCEPFENRPLGYYDPDGIFQFTSVRLEITAEVVPPE